MKEWCGGAIFLVISIICITGCATNIDALDRDEPDNFGRPPSEDAPWPDYIPAEIPELPGEIRTIMVAPKSHIRLFYINVPDEQIEEYLDLLVDKGFELEYRIHVQEGFPDKSEERRQRGEYDDIDITKGEYHMTLSHWEGTATYDVYTSGFQEIVEEATALTWPEALNGILPPPERCELVTINSGANHTYHVSCQREDESVDQDYLDLLISHGFQIQEVFQTDQGGITLIRLRRVDLVVDLSSSSSMYFTLYVFVDPLPQWPDVFGDIVPRPVGCELTAIIPTMNDDDHHITCNPRDENVLREYVHVLEELGFVGDVKFLNDQDEINSIRLYNDEIKVDIYNNSPDSMSVSVAPKGP